MRSVTPSAARAPPAASTLASAVEHRSVALVPIRPAPLDAALSDRAPGSMRQIGPSIPVQPVEDNPRNRGKPVADSTTIARPDARLCANPVGGRGEVVDKLTSMRAFTKVVAHGSFSEAARELRLSRSAVSKYVIDLEQELGVQLLNRTTRRASPTESGQAYYERCLAILAELQEADLLVSRAQAEPRGLLRVNAPMSFGTLHLGGALADFMALHPQLQVQMILSDQLIDPVQE